jgi:hypothetical protein
LEVNHPLQFLSLLHWSWIMDNRRVKILLFLVIFMVLSMLLFQLLKTIMYHHNAASMMMAFFYLGAMRGWCRNLIGQVDMCHNFFLDHIVQECFKTIYGWVGLHLHTVYYPQDQQKLIILPWILWKSEIIGGSCLKSQELCRSSA